jgi:hypothetical protein
MRVSMRPTAAWARLQDRRMAGDLDTSDSRSGPDVPAKPVSRSLIESQRYYSPSFTRFHPNAPTRHPGRLMSTRPSRYSV